MFRIWFKQEEKKTGRVVGTGCSTKGYKSVAIARRYTSRYEFENEDFRQEVVDISSWSLFKKN